MANKVFLSTESGLVEVNSNDIKDVTINFNSGAENEVILGENGNLNGLTINVDGSFNTVNIGNKTSLTNCTIMLNGNFNYRKISIGKGTYIGGGLIQALRDNSVVEIGEDCMLSTGINVVNNYGINIYDLSTNKIINQFHNIYIGNHVWLGRNSFINSDTIIADDCIVGARSFVSGHFMKSCCSIAGNPARVVKRNINFIKCHTDNFIKAISIMNKTN